MTARNIIFTAAARRAAAVIESRSVCVCVCVWVLSLKSLSKRPSSFCLIHLGAAQGWKPTFDGKRTLMEDTLWWKTINDGSRPIPIQIHIPILIPILFFFIIIYLFQPMHIYKNLTNRLSRGILASFLCCIVVGLLLFSVSVRLIFSSFLVFSRKTYS